MQDPDYNTTIIHEHEDYPSRSGCRSIAIALVIIIAFWVVVGCIYLFT